MINILFYLYILYNRIYFKQTIDPCIYINIFFILPHHHNTPFRFKENENDAEKAILSVATATQILALYCLITLEYLNQSITDDV